MLRTGGCVFNTLTNVNFCALYHRNTVVDRGLDSVSQLYRGIPSKAYWTPPSFLLRRTVQLLYFIRFLPKQPPNRDNKIDFAEPTSHSARLPNRLQWLIAHFPGLYYPKCHVLSLSAFLASFVTFRHALVMPETRAPDTAMLIDDVIVWVDAAEYSIWLPLKPSFHLITNS